MRTCLWMVAVLGLIAPVSGAYYLAGEFNSWDAGSDAMTEISSGVWAKTITGLGAGQRQEFKVTDGSWDWNFPGPNSWYYADGDGAVTVTFNTNMEADGWQPEQYRIGLSTEPGAWTVAGSFQGWDNANPATAMTSLGNGVYMLSVTLAPGTYEFKPVVTGTWDSISWDGRSVATANISVETTPGFEIVNIYVDALGGAVRTEVIPEPATMALLGLGSLAVVSRRRR